MSLVVAVLDPQTGTVEESVAGQAPPVHTRAGTAAPVAATPGMVLGMPFIGGRGYERVELRLDPGDALLLFSHGLFVLLDRVGALDVGEQEDDRTALLVRYAGRGSS